MQKTTFMLGAGIGFVLGSRTGRGPYQQLESKIREITRRPEVQDKVEQLKDTIKDQAGMVAEKAARSESSSGSESSTGRVAPPDPAPKSYADPQDLQFSTAAARKEEMVDDLLKQGVPPAEMEQKEDELRRSGALSEPRAGNKPEPVKDR
jgi:hypothetical protein